MYDDTEPTPTTYATIADLIQQEIKMALLGSDLDLIGDQWATVPNHVLHELERRGLIRWESGYDELDDTYHLNRQGYQYVGTPDDFWSAAVYVLSR